MPIKFSFREPRHYGNLGKSQSAIDILEDITGFHSLFLAEHGIHRRPGDQSRITQWDASVGTGSFIQNNNNYQPERKQQEGQIVLGFSNNATMGINSNFGVKSEFSIAIKLFQKASQVNNQDILGQRTDNPHNWMRYIHQTGMTQYRYYYEGNTNFVNFLTDDVDEWKKIIITTGNGAFNFGVNSSELVTVPLTGDMDFSNFYIGSYNSNVGRSYVDIKTIMFFDYDLASNETDVENVLTILDIL